MVVVNDPADRQGTLKQFGGSQSDEWNNVILNQAVQSLWLKNYDEKARDQKSSATVAGLRGIEPKDELEGMIAVQLIAAHGAAMECYRRAMMDQQTLEGRRENLTQAKKLSRTYAVLLEALNRHRGKGQQKITIEHVSVHAGGQAIVGHVETPGGGPQAKSEVQPHAIAHTPSAEVRSANPRRQPVPVASDVERPLPDARGHVAGSTEG
jgi:hypothetical protein